MKTCHDYKRIILVALCILAAFALTAYPFVSNRIYEKQADSEVAALKAASAGGTDAEKEAQLEAARKYNAGLTASRARLADPFQGEAAEDGAYRSLLNMTEDGVMGFLSIPSIDLQLPIRHGTSLDVLEHGVGHMEGTSLPVGGAGTHAVLTGHTGLSGAKLFTDLVLLQEGDLFFLDVCGEKLAYRVDQIKIVEPEDTKDLAVISGKDYCTLVTCTPYGINSHRLLVRGARTGYEEAAADRNTLQKKEAASPWMQEYKKALLAGFAALAACLFTYRLTQNARKKRRKKHP